MYRYINAFVHQKRLIQQNELCKLNFLSSHMHLVQLWRWYMYMYMSVDTKLFYSMPLARVVLQIQPSLIACLLLLRAVKSIE
jgi:hypothetical protein